MTEYFTNIMIFSKKYGTAFLLSSSYANAYGKTNCARMLLFHMIDRYHDVGDRGDVFTLGCFVNVA